MVVPHIFNIMYCTLGTCKNPELKIPSIADYLNKITKAISESRDLGLGIT